MVSDINAYKHIPEYQTLQKLDPSLKAPKGVIQKALKWIEKKVDSLSSLFKDKTTISKEKNDKMHVQFNKLEKLKNDYDQVDKRMEYLTFRLNRLPIQLTSKKSSITCKTYDRFNERKKKLNEENLKIKKEITSEINYIESLYSFKFATYCKIQHKLDDITGWK